MKLLGFCNLFVRKVNVEGNVYNFLELSISSKYKDGSFRNIRITANFKKDLVDYNELEENTCYNIEILDSIVNVVHDDFKKQNILKVTILDFDFKKTTAVENNKPVSKKKSPNKIDKMLLV